MVFRSERLEKYRGMKAGREFEVEHLGTVQVTDPKFREELMKIAQEGRAGKPYVPYRESLEFVKKFQPFDPKNPKKDFLRELRLAVAEKLGFETNKDIDQVAVYTAVESPLDILHGVDAFVAVSKHGEREEIVTLDLTVGEARRGEKMETAGGADIVVADIDLPGVEENEQAYLAAIDQIAEQIARKIRRQEVAAAE